MSHYKEINACRVCNNNSLIEVISIDEQFLSPTFVETNKNNYLSDIKVKQTLVLCEKEKGGCGLLQMKETVNPDLLYRQYFYRTSTNEMMKNDLKKVVEFCKYNTNLFKDDIVVDIGANDCTMVQWFPENCKRIGVEPAKNINWESVKNVTIVNDYFNKESLLPHLDGKKVKAFTACAMFYDLDDPNSFVSGIKECLDDNGIFVIQLSYLPGMLKNMNFYDICNEHLEYYSLETLNTLMLRNDLEIYDAIENDVNGGSVLVSISHRGKKNKTERFNSLLELEKDFKLFEKETYENFYNKILSLKTKVNNYIQNELNKNNKVIGLGASTKGNMLLQLFGINKNILPYISERNRDKVGLRTLGTDIELISEESARDMNPSCMLVLPWYFKKEIVERENEYIKNGGSLLFPMPYAHIVDKDGEKYV